MKAFQKWVFILGLALAGQARAAEGGAPGLYTGTAVDGKGQAAANIEGKVIVAGTGQPLSGVKLRWLMTNEMREPVLSGPDGAFRLAGIAPGRAAITAVFPGEPVADWVAEDVTVTVASGETRKDVLVRALKGGVAAITVLSRQDRKPLAKVPVSISSQLSPSPVIAVTGADGVARVRLLPDRWHISVNQERRNGTQPYVVVATGHTNTAELEVDPVLKITGTVRDPAGAPAAGAVVSISGDFVNSHEVRTDTNGRYELTWQRAVGMMDVMMVGGESMYLTARSADRNLVVVHDIDEDTTNLELTLQPSVTLSAKVEDPAGQPVTNAVAYAYPMKGDRGYGAIERKPSPSDARGRIEIAGVMQADSYNLQVTAKGYGSMFQQMPMPDPPTNRLEFPTMVLPLANQKLGGQILDTDGKPVAGVLVQAVAVTNVVKPLAGLPDAWEVVAVRGRFQGSRQTDSQGRFFFDEVCEGPIQLDISYQGPSVSAQTIGGTTNILLRLDLSNVNVRNNINNIMRGPAPNQVVRITGTVRDPSGAPAAGVRLRLWGGVPEPRRSYDRRGWALLAELAEAGKFSADCHFCARRGAQFGGKP